MRNLIDSTGAPHQQKLLELITQSWTAQAAYVAAELGIADLPARRFATQ